MKPMENLCNLPAVRAALSVASQRPPFGRNAAKSDILCRMGNYFLNIEVLSQLRQNPQRLCAMLVPRQDRVQPNGRSAPVIGLLCAAAVDDPRSQCRRRPLRPQRPQRCLFRNSIAHQNQHLPLLHGQPHALRSVCLSHTEPRRRRGCSYFSDAVAAPQIGRCRTPFM